MYFRNQMMRYGMGFCEGAGDDGDKGGGGGDTAAELAKMKTQIETLTTNLTAVTDERDKLTGKIGEAEKHRKAAEKKAADEAAAALLKSGDVEAIKESYDSKIATMTSDFESTIKDLNGVISKVTVGATAKTLAAELALDGSGSVLEPHIMGRLSMELKDGNPIITVLDVNGKPSASTLADLKEEIGNNAGFAPILKGSDASGSGGAGKGGKGATGKTMKRSVFDALPQSEKSAAVTGKDKVTIVDD